MTTLPWNRDINLAIQVQEKLQDPLKLAELADNIPSFMRHLSVREVEDEEFDFQAWKPEPVRKTLLPIPEHVKAPSSTLEEAHDAMLDAMEEENLPEEPLIEEEPIQIKIERREPESDVIEEEEELVEEEIHPEPIVQKHTASSKTINSEKISIRTYQSLLRTLGLKETAESLEEPGVDSVKLIRKSIATHVGVEPRDVRVDRMLRIILRLLPVGDENDAIRSKLINKIESAIPKYNKWMKSRLEARHSGSKGNFLQDTKNLGNALNRIPGPGFALPLNKDDKDLPNLQDLAELSKEVEKLVKSMNLPSASGIVVEAV